MTSNRKSAAAPAVVRRVAPATKKPDARNPAAVALGRLGGLKGGVARAAKLTAKRRQAIARKAARIRWGK